MKLYSIYDKAANEYAPPFESKNDMVAIRAAKQMLGKMPPAAIADFELVYVGSFDQDSGTVSGVGEPHKIPMSIPTELPVNVVPTKEVAHA